MTTLSGRATAEETRRFAARFPRPPGGFRQIQHLTVSSLGLGTFEGSADDGTDAGYAAAIQRALARGCNLIDTSVAYRHQRSERVIGRVLAHRIGEGTVGREAVVVSSKAGFIPFDSGYSGRVEEYFEETFVRPGVVAPADVVDGRHCLAPAFLQHQIQTSRNNLGCGTIDIYFLHNPETQLREVARRDFRSRILAAFEVLECAVAEGWIGLYGVSTWNGFRLPSGERGYLSLNDLFLCANEVGGPDHHFRVVMAPFNLAMPEMYSLSNQTVPRASTPVPLLRAAGDLGIAVVAGSSLHRARLASALPPEIRAALDGGLRTDAQRALQFARSAPGLAAALVGMSRPSHVDENLEVAAVPPLSPDRFDEFFDP